MQIQRRRHGYQEIYLCKLAQSQKIEIPSEWTVKKLKNISSINPEKIENDYPYKEILYVDIASIENFQINEYQKLDLDKRPSRAQRIIKKDDIIVSTVRPYLKGFAKVTDSKPNLVCSTGFAVIRPKHPEDVDLVFNFIKGHEFEIDIIRQMEGMAYPAVTSSTISNSLMPYSKNSTERKKIASILSNVDSLIQQTQKELEQTQRLKKGLMQKIFTKGLDHTKFKEIEFGSYFIRREIPESWIVDTVKNSSEKLVVGFVGTCEPYYVENYGIPLLRTTNVKEGEFDLSNLKYVTREFHEKNKKSQVKEGDILVSRHGENGEACLVRDIKEANCLNIVIIRPKKDLFLPEFFELAFNSYIVRRQIQRTTAGGVQDVVNTSEIGKAKIIIPDLKEQNRIVSIFNNIRSQLHKKEDYKSNLENLKKGLIQKLLTGQIRVKV